MSVHLAGIEEKFHAIDLHGQAGEDAVGLDVIQHVRLPEQDHVAVVGVHLFVDVLVQGGVAEVDRAALAEVTLEEGVELVEEFFAEIWEGLQGFRDILLELREDALLVIA